MPSFSNSLEEFLHRAIEYANERHHEYATLEHLLLSLVDDRDAASVMRACNVDLDRLRAKLTDFIDKELSNLILDQDGEAQPTASFQRVSIAPSCMFNLPGVRRSRAPMCSSRFSQSARATPRSS